MRKSLFFAFSLCCGLVLSSCANSLNEKNPDASSTLASELGVNYGSENTTVSDEVSGSLTSSYDYDIWYFNSASDETEYLIEWENSDGAKVAVSVSSEPTFSNTSRIVFENDKSGSHTIKVLYKRKVYIKVEPYNNYYYNTGSYTLKVSGKTDSIYLYKY